MITPDTGRLGAVQLSAANRSAPCPVPRPHDVDAPKRSQTPIFLARRPRPARFDRSRCAAARAGGTLAPFSVNVPAVGIDEWARHRGPYGTRSSTRRTTTIRRDTSAISSERASPADASGRRGDDNDDGRCDVRTAERPECVAELLASPCDERPTNAGSATRRSRDLVQLAAITAAPEVPVKPEIYRLPSVVAACGISRSTIYEMIGRGEFPAPVKLGARAVGWRRRDIEAWLESRPAA